MNFTPTQEQLTILQEFNNHRVMKINAVAGSGKEQPQDVDVLIDYRSTDGIEINNADGWYIYDESKIVVHITT